MRLSCHCLNVTLDIISEENDTRFGEIIVKPETLCLSEDAFGDPFFCQTANNVAAVMIKDERDVVERLPMLVRKRSLDNWEIRKCLLCNMYTYATNSLTPGRLLVSLKMLSDETAISERRKSPDYSKTFQVILPKKTTVAPLLDTTYTAGNTNGLIVSGASSVSRYALNLIQDATAACLKREQHEMEDRIQKFADEQHAAFEQFKANVKSERSTLLSLVAYHRTMDIQSGIDDDENDSAVPLSPLSVRSGDPSPGFMGYQPNAATTASINYFYECFGSDYANNGNAAAVSRPKALSNPASLTSWKRKRHSGGSGKAPTLTSYPEEQQDIFSFEEHENFDNRDFYNLPADDEDDTDDSGTSCGYFSNYYSTKIDCDPPQIPNNNTEKNDYCFNDALVFGKSLPVTIVAPTTTNKTIIAQNGCGAFFPTPCQQMFDEGESNNKVQTTGEAPQDVGASMLALARSIRAEDDPERLFGERPHRRRYKTAGDFVHGPADAQPRRLVINVAERRPSAF